MLVAAVLFIAATGQTGEDLPIAVSPAVSKDPGPASSRG